MKKTTTASKMLTAILTYALVFQPTLNSYAQDPYGSSNVVAGGGGGAGFDEPNCADEGLSAGQTCVTDDGKLAHFKKYSTKKGVLGTGIGNRVRGNYVATLFTKKELQAYYAGQNSGGSGGGRGRGNGSTRVIYVDNGGGGNRGGGNVYRRGGGDDGYDDDGGRGGRGGRGNRSAQDDFDLLNQFCGDYENLYENAVNKKKELEEQIAAIKIDDLKSAERDAYNRMLTDCREGCVDLAINPSSACVITDQRQLIEIFSKSDLVKIGGYVNGQTEVISAIERKNSADPALVCTLILGKKGCLEQIMKDGGIKTNAGIKTCEASASWIAAKNALDDASKKLAQLQADLDAIAGDVKSPNSCKVASARDLDRAPWRSCYNADNVSGSTCNIKCLEKNTTDSCADALANAQIVIRKSPRNGSCPTCGQGGGGRGDDGGVIAECTAANNFCNGQGNGNGNGGYCIYGPCNTSKAAQIISAIGGIGVPLGLGLMNMSMQNRSLNACISTYAQQVEVAKTVGLPPQASMCGLSYGMGMGGMGMGGMGGMMGMGGMGGMYPGMMGMGGMGGMGMGGMYPGMGIYGGLNLGMGMGYPGFGGGMMYPGMGGMGGMGGMYPGMGGMGGMGMYNPMMGIYGSAMGSMQGSMMGVQQQMYNAQMAMQQMAAQNMVLQNSMYSGMGGGMYGMGMGGMGGMYGGMGMGYNPYMYSGYNPYGMYGGGSGLNFGLNLGLNFGTGYNPYMNTGYNPYMMYGGGMGGGMYPGSYYIGQ